MRRNGFAVGRLAKSTSVVLLRPSLCRRAPRLTNFSGSRPFFALLGTSQFGKEFLISGRCISELNCRSSESSANQRQHMRNLV
jgi:hypothetical protein